MAETDDAYNEINKIRRELAQLHRKVDATLALTLAADTGVPAEVILHQAAGMTYADIARMLRKKPDAVRMKISRYLATEGGDA